MEDVSALEFINEKSIRVYFSKKKSRIFDYVPEKRSDGNTKDIIETRGSLYHKVIVNDMAGWFDKDFTRVPTSIEHKLNQVVNKILKSNKN